MEEQNLIPELRFSEFTKNWCVDKFENLTKINQGLQIPIAERYTEQIEGSYFYITNEFLKKNSDKKYYILNPTESVLCNKDDVLMTRTGNTGQVVTNVVGAFHNNFFKIKFDNEKINKDFLVYFLRLYKTQNAILRLAGTSTIPDLNHSDFYRIEMPHPNPTEQKKIATFLTAIDKRINLLQKKKAELEQYKKGVMQQLFSVKTDCNPSLRFKKEDGSDFEDWEVKKLGEVSDITTGSSNRQDSTLDGEYTFFDRSEDIRTSSIFLFDGEAIIVAGEGSDFVPKYFVGKFDLHQRTYAIMNFVNSNGLFLYYYIGYYRNYFLSQAVGSTVKSLRLPMFKKMPIKCPEVEEQQKIAKFLSSIDKSIENITNQIDDSVLFKKGLLQKMFC